MVQRGRSSAHILDDGTGTIDYGNSLEPFEFDETAKHRSKLWWTSCSCHNFYLFSFHRGGILSFYSIESHFSCCYNDSNSWYLPPNTVLFSILFKRMGKWFPETRIWYLRILWCLSFTLRRSGKTSFTLLWKKKQTKSAQSLIICECQQVCLLWYTKCAYNYGSYKNINATSVLGYWFLPRKD